MNCKKWNAISDIYFANEITLDARESTGLLRCVRDSISNSFNPNRGHRRNHGEYDVNDGYMSQFQPLAIAHTAIFPFTHNARKSVMEEVNTITSSMYQYHRLGEASQRRPTPWGFLMCVSSDDPWRHPPVVLVVINNPQAGENQHS
jgi:hypothetical protein